MPKQNRKPGIHLHKSMPSISEAQIGIGAEYYWILISKNGKTIARSSETYKRKRDAVRSIKVASDIIRYVKPSSFYDHTGKEVKQVVY